jgi:MtrB/PioB family decaheme-associated outer membrane protein
MRTETTLSRSASQLADLALTRTVLAGTVLAGTVLARTVLAGTVLAGTLLGWAGPAAADEAFKITVDSVDLGILDKDADTRSAKFQEYRDLSSGFDLTNLRIHGEEDGGNRHLFVRADKVGRDDARYGLDYGVSGRYAFSVDYNKIPHRFGNDGTILWNRTGPGTWEIADPVQAQLQGAVIDQFPSGISAGFLTGLIAPHLAAAGGIDLGLQRDRTRIRLDLGKMGKLAWGAEVRHENREGLRPFGGNFGFNNATEIPETIDYSTTDAELTGEWNGKQGGLRFGYRYSMFENDISTLTWDNPWVAVDGTNPVAYLGPNSSPFSGSRGFADLAPDNDASTFFASGRGRFGGWWANGTASYALMQQDEPLLPYTLNTAILGIGHDGSTFDASDVNTLPVRNADTEVEVLSLTGNAGTKLGEDWKLTFRYRYYDYDTNSARVEFPGYVRMHAAWEAIPRVTVPYAYTKDDLGAELAWEVTDTSTLALSYRLVSWDREFREVASSDEDIVKLSFDSRPTRKVNIRASYEIGDRSIDDYEVEAQHASFLEPEEVNNQPGLRKFSQAARDVDDYDLSIQLFPADTWNVTFGVSGREEDYPESEFGLVSDDVFQYNFEVAFTPSADLDLYLFGHRADREVFQSSRQSGGSLSTSPADNWSATLDEVVDTWGLGYHGKKGDFSWEVTGRWSSSDGEADFETPPGGSPSSAVDFGNYEDIELLALNLNLDWAVRSHCAVGLWYLYEDFTTDSFILAGVQPYLPGSFLLAPNNGDYQANVFGLSLKLRLGTD